MYPIIFLFFRTQTRGGRGGRGGCYHCHQDGHIARVCPEPRQESELHYTNGNPYDPQTGRRKYPFMNLTPETNGTLARGGRRGRGGRGRGRGRGRQGNQF